MDGSGHHFAKKSSSFNGMQPHSGGHHHHYSQGHHERKWRTFKLLVDPLLKKGHQKLYRYDGIVPGALNADLNATEPKDPRSRLSRLLNRRELPDLPVPKFKVDKYFVGELPPKQITFTNLNDNVREQFLRSMCERYGDLESIRIYHHPKTKKHLGLASVTYTKTRYAKEAAMGLNRTSVMGRIIIVQVDAGGKECQRTFECLVNNTTPSTPGASSTSSGPRDPRGRGPSETPGKTPSLPPTPHSDRGSVNQIASDHVGPGFISQGSDGFITPNTPSDGMHTPHVNNRFANMNMQPDFNIPQGMPPQYQSHPATLSDFMQPDGGRPPYRRPYHERPGPGPGEQPRFGPGPVHPSQQGFMEPPAMMPPQQPFFPADNEWNQGNFQPPPMQNPPNTNEFGFQPNFNNAGFTPQPEPNFGHVSHREEEPANPPETAIINEPPQEAEVDDFELKKREKNRRKRKNQKEKKQRERTLTAGSQLGDLILPQVGKNEHSRPEPKRPEVDRRMSIASDLSEPNEAQQDEDDEFRRSLDSRIEALLEQSHTPIEFGVKDLKSPERRNSTIEEQSRLKAAGENLPSGVQHSSKGFSDKSSRHSESLHKHSSSHHHRHSRKASPGSRMYDERRRDSSSKTVPRDSYSSSSRHGNDHDRRRRRPSSPPPPPPPPTSDSTIALGDLSPENIGDSPLDASDDIRKGNSPRLEQSLSSTPVKDEGSDRLSTSKVSDEEEGGQQPMDQGTDEEDRMSMSSLSDDGDDGAKLQVHAPPPLGMTSQLPLPGEPPQQPGENVMNPTMAPWMRNQNNMPGGSHGMGPNQMLNEMMNSGPMFPNFGPWMNNPNFHPMFPNCMPNPGDFPPNFHGPMGPFDGPPNNFNGDFPPFGPHPGGPGGMPFSHSGDPGGSPFFPPGMGPGMNNPQNFEQPPHNFAAHLQTMAGMSGMFHGMGGPSGPMGNRLFPDFGSPPRGPFGPNANPDFLPEFSNMNQMNANQNIMMNMGNNFQLSPEKLQDREGQDWAAPVKPSEPEQILVDDVLMVMVMELKQIVNRDLGRKIVETCAFKTFETWWDDSVLKSKPIKEEDEVSSEVKVERPLPPSMFDSKDWTKNAPSDSFNLGLGFRAGMPRMPSFKVKRKLPSPRPDREEDDDDDDDEGSKARPVTPPLLDEDLSDTEKETAETTSQVSDEEGDKDESKRVRKLSTSSEESEDDEDDEEEDEEDDDEVEEEEEVEVKVKGRRKTKLTAEIVDDSGSSDEDASGEESEDEDDESSSSEDDEELEDDETSISGKSPRSKLETITEEADDRGSQVAVSSQEERASKKSESADIAGEKSLKRREDEESAASPTRPNHEPGLPSVTASFEREDGLDKMKMLAEIATHAKEFSDRDRKKLKEKLPRIELFKLSEEDISVAKRRASEDGDDSGRNDEMIDIESQDETKPAKVQRSASLVDHNYCMDIPVVETEPEMKSPKKLEKALAEPVLSKSEQKKKDKEAKKRKRKSQLESLFDVFPEKVVEPSPVAKERTDFTPRNYYEEWSLLYDFLGKGLDREDACFLRKSYDILLQDGRIPWLSYTHWVAHSLTCIPDPPRKKQKKEEVKVHSSGSARTEGYYHLTDNDKMKYMQNSKLMVAEQLGVDANDDSNVEDSKKGSSRLEISREARSDQRRIMATIKHDGAVSDLLKFNQLKFRKKELKFAKSGIHGWGLYAMEDIAADEMVIEYVGEGIRQSIADERETNYEKMGIGSSYLFRIDSGCIIDATKCGNLARFINHSCMPNCYAKIINVDSMKKITIYSKEPIRIGQEITYDYKFPIEDDKIVCLCGTPQCRGTLN